MSVATTSASAIPPSSALWATASKEWVIPPKPKPGRKPKKENTASAPSPPTDSGPPTPTDTTSAAPEAGRRVQNRAAQRAFRERKQSQLAELQARIKQYEQGEIERNVALQQVAKRLKDENDQLREENASLKEKLAQAERERDAAMEAASASASGMRAKLESENEAKRPREDFLAEADLPLRKKTRLGIDDLVQGPTASVAGTLPFFASTPSLVSSPRSRSSAHSLSPVPEPLPQSSSLDPHVPLSSSYEYQPDASSSSRPPVYESAAPTRTYDCGFCADSDLCVCRELSVQTQAPPPSQQHLPHRSEPLKPEQAPSLLNTVDVNRSNILDNLPAYQPPVPLRRRTGNPQAKRLFPVISIAQDFPADRTAQNATCSGDPSNCLACADDAFGKAFCVAVGAAVASQGRCDNCPERRQSGSADEVAAGLCCGVPNFCGGCKPSAPGAELPPIEDIIPTSDAWRQLKSHPNVSFADLSLLADVVARRTKCTGPTTVIEPAPGAFTPERVPSPTAGPSIAISTESAGAVLLSDPHAIFKQMQTDRQAPSSPPPRLVPHEELLECSRRRVRMVNADGVREALRILDAKLGLV